MLKVEAYFDFGSYVNLKAQISLLQYDSFHKDMDT
jgi:hypothetical protein